MKKHQLYNRGFTLIEILIALVILSTVGAGLLSLQFILGQNQVIVFKNYLSADEANTAVSMFIKEVRTAREGDNAAYVFDTIEDQEIVFYSDIDFDGETEKIRYTLNGSLLEKGTIEPVGYPATYPEDQEKIRTLTEIIRNGSTPVFYYYNEDWPEDDINNPLILGQRLAQTKTVRIYLSLNPNQDEGDANFILDSYVQIRMLKENL